MRRHYIHVYLIVIISLTLFTTPAYSQEEYLKYGIPPDARRAIILSRDTKFGYFDARDILVATETVDDRTKNVVQRELFKDGKSHGVQLTWYPNGEKKTSKPFENGVMNGVFRSWDEKGLLVECSLILQGSGREEIYYSTGILKHIIEYKGNMRDGMSLDFYPNGQLLSYAVYKQGRLSGASFDFYDDGLLRSYGSVDDHGNLQGPFVEFAPDGSISKKVFIIHTNHDQIVTEAEYTVATQKNPKLPIFQNDPNYYRSLIPDSLKRLQVEFKTKPPAAIPLKDI